jgi:hypothetical protein
MRLVAQKAEQAVLRKGDVAAGELLRKVENEAPLQRGKDVGEPLRVLTHPVNFRDIRHN